MSSLWSTPSFIKIAKELHDAGVNFPVGPGIKVARGFADLGAEEFSVLPGKKLVSLFTGEKSSIPDDFEKHFFVIPTVTELIEAFHLYHLVLPLVELSDEGSWIVEGLKVESLEEELAVRILEAIRPNKIDEKPKSKLIAV